MTIKEVSEEIGERISSEETQNAQSYPQAHLINMVMAIWAEYFMKQSEGDN